MYPSATGSGIWCNGHMFITVNIIERSISLRIIKVRTMCRIEKSNYKRALSGMMDFTQVIKFRGLCCNYKCTANISRENNHRKSLRYTRVLYHNWRGLRLVQIIVCHLLNAWCRTDPLLTGSLWTNFSDMGIQPHLRPVNKLYLKIPTV